ncbi:MAG: insulinase family protein [Alphaproteobacteria bacterium]|nr:insulinase family protein [Alphaproteobacteria bacterium]
MTRRVLARRLATAALLAGGLAMALPAAAKVFEPTHFTLANGLEIVVVGNHRAAVVTHMVWYRVGAADEPASRSGIAHFLEHLMFKGTTKRAPGEFSALVSRNGGRENAFTGPDYTAYYQTVAGDRLELVMELEADRMTNLTLTDAQIEPERKVVLEERGARVDSDPRSILSEQVQAAAWLNHPYRLPIIGWRHEIEALSRADIVDFYRTWYAPNNAVLVVAGDVAPEAVRALAEKYYGVIPARTVPARLRPAEPPQLAPRVVTLSDARVEQPSWSRRWLAPSHRAGERAHAYPLELLAEVLGGGATSRLYRALVVEQEVAVSAGAWYDGDAWDLGSFGIWLAPRSGMPLDRAVAALEAEVAKLLAEGVQPVEVARARQRLVDSAVFARDDLSAAARVLGEALATGKTVADVEAWPERIAVVTPAQIDAAARAVLRPAASTTGVLLPAVSLAGPAQWPAAPPPPPAGAGEIR